MLHVVHSLLRKIRYLCNAGPATYCELGFTAKNLEVKQHSTMLQLHGTVSGSVLIFKTKAFKFFLTFDRQQDHSIVGYSFIPSIQPIKTAISRRVYKLIMIPVAYNVGL